jgi:hypothetical protein
MPIESGENGIESVGKGTMREPESAWRDSRDGNENGGEKERLKETGTGNGRWNGNEKDSENGNENSDAQEQEADRRVLIQRPSP